MFQKDNLVFYDLSSKQLRVSQRDADTWVDSIMSEQFEALTLSEIYNNGFIELTPTYVKKRQLEKSSGSGKKFNSPWTQIGSAMPTYDNPKVQAREEEKILNKSYRFCATISMEILPIKPMTL